MGFIPPAIWVMLAACMYGSLVNTSMLLNDSKGSGEQSTFSPARSPGFLNICGRTLHHLHCSEHRAGGGGGERECSHREIVALAAMLSSDLPLCYQFQIQMQNSSLWNLTFPPPPSLSLFLLSLSSWLPLFCAPSRLSISSRLALKSLFQFQNALKPMPAARAPQLPTPLLESELWDSLPFFPSSLYFSLLCHQSSTSLSLSSPHLVLPISLHFFFYWMYCSSLKNWFLDRGEVNLLWPGIPCWASTSLSPSLTFLS